MERKAYYRPSGWGYTMSLKEAGEFDLDDAYNICLKENALNEGICHPSEVMVPVPAPVPVPVDPNPDKKQEQAQNEPANTQLQF